MEDKQHALLGASTSARWMTCTPSAVLERQANEGEEETCSTYAQEGTVGHALGELLLSKAFHKVTDEMYEEQLKLFKEDELTKQYYNKALEESVQEYVDFVVQQAKTLGEDTIVDFEVRVDFSEYVPEGFGTSDTLLFNKIKKVIHIIDLKLGQGVPVDAVDNSQLMLYALGGLNKYKDYEVDEVMMSISQPRLYSTSTSSMNTKDLVAWGNDYVKPRAELAYKGEGQFVASEKGCRFCKMKSKCKTRADLQLTKAQEEFGPIVTKNNVLPLKELTPEQISNILSLGESFVAWFNDVKSYALGQLVQGIKIPGFKLVGGKSHRTITNEQAIVDKLKSLGADEDVLYKPRELQGITNLEKLVGKKLFASLFDEYITKTPGNLTFAPESDPRPEANIIEIAKSDFKEVENNMTNKGEN